MTRRAVIGRLLATPIASAGLRYHAYGSGVPVWHGYWEWGGTVIRWVRR